MKKWKHREIEHRQSSLYLVAVLAELSRPFTSLLSPNFTSLHLALFLNTCVLRRLHKVRLFPVYATLIS
jgi:hypothetical protein